MEFRESPHERHIFDNVGFPQKLRKIGCLLPCGSITAFDPILEPRFHLPKLYVNKFSTCSRND